MAGRLKRPIFDLPGQMTRAFVNDFFMPPPSIEEPFREAEILKRRALNLPGTGRSQNRPRAISGGENIAAAAGRAVRWVARPISAR